MKSFSRWLSLFSFLLIVGCGSDSDTKSDGNDAKSDAGTASENKPPEKTSENQSGNATPENKDAGTSMQQTAAADGCKSLSCKEPAQCEEKDGKARCTCPKGYEDVKGDGSECKDIDECDKGEDDCDKRAKCENKPGGFECKCPSPAYVGDGKKCSCAEGYKEEDGYCEAPDGKSCEDNADCQNNHCVSGICCAEACSSPGAECTTAEGATCADGKTCKYPTAKDGSACEDEDACTNGSTCKEGKCQKGETPRDCDDKNPCTDDSCDSKIGCKNSNNTATCDDKNPCTLTDVCKNGSCQSTGLKDCTTENDTCNTGVCDPESGNCKKQPMGEGLACNDADSCTKTDQCKGGACKGDGNACGPNASACTAGMPNTCTCNTGYHAANGLCVPDNDECAQNPCGANADCFDPSNNAGDATCTCKTDYEGDAKAGCTAKNPCMGNPCGEGRGTCTNGIAGKYTCTCGAGFKAVAGKCVCDMQGTFAVRSELKLAWSNIDGIVDGSGSTYSWSIARHNYDAEGNLTAEMIQCGDTNLDICGTGVRIVGIPSEAYAQFVPIAAYDKGAASSAEFAFKLESPLPGSDYKTPNFGSLMGISLTDPLGTWPASRKDVQGGNDFDGSATNGARWIDTDGDTFFGLTTYAVGPNGAPADGSELAPIEGYTGRSPSCNLPYNYPPALDGLTTRRIKRFSSANRVISAFDGKLDSCDALSGNVTGPDDGKVHYDIRIGNCTRTDLNGNNEGACSSGLLDYLDSTQTPNQVDSDSFKAKRVKDDITCKEVRALTY